jgi:hypothetical protein
MWQDLASKSTTIELCRINLCSELVIVNQVVKHFDKNVVDREITEKFIHIDIYGVVCFFTALTFKLSSSRNTTLIFCIRQILEKNWNIMGQYISYL